MVYKRFSFTRRIIENMILRWSIQVKNTLVSLSVDNLGRRLYLTGVSSGKMNVAICSTQSTSQNVVVCIWQTSYYYFKENELRDPLSQVTLEFSGVPNPRGSQVSFLGDSGHQVPLFRYAFCLTYFLI